MCNVNGVIAIILVQENDGTVQHLRQCKYVYFAKPYQSFQQKYQTKNTNQEHRHGAEYSQAQLPWQLDPSRPWAQIHLAIEYYY